MFKRIISLSKLDSFVVEYPHWYNFQLSGITFSCSIIIVEEVFRNKFFLCPPCFSPGSPLAADRFVTFVEDCAIVLLIGI